ncbi:hypothetical protein EMF73_32320 [Klebsiella pneumoniae]|nr:hypothetical protein EMF73_32320 [Klebsiella pneumoniae]
MASSQYGFTDAAIAGVLGQIGQKAPSSRFLFDRSEYMGRYEKPVVDALIAKLQPDQWAIGTAPDGSDILHSKILCLLYPDGTGWTFSGSFNLSASAAREANIADFIWSRARAEAFAAEIQKNLTWCRQHQPQPPQPEARTGDGQGREEETEGVANWSADSGR